MKKIVLTGGGTAGHVTPNLALIPALKQQGYDIIYIGSEQGMEKDDNDDTEKDSDESNSVKENDSTHNKDNTQNKNNIQNGDDMQNIKQPESDRKEYSDLSEHDSIKNSDIVIASEKEKVLDTVPETGDNNRFVNLFVFLGTAVTLFYFIRTFKEQPKNR